MKRFWFLILAAVLIAGCGSDHAEGDGHDHGAEAAHGEEGHDEHEEGKIELTPDQLKLAGVEVGKAEIRNFRSELEVPGTVTSTSKGRAVVTPPVAGRVVSISAQLGDQVRQGQVLAVLESSELALSWSSVADAQRARDAASAELREAQAEAKLANSKIQAARQTLNRQRELAKTGAFSQAAVQQAQNELNDVQSELLSIQKEQAIHAEQLRRMESLFREGLVSRADLETARLELQKDEIELDRVKARIEIAKSAYEREKLIASRGLINAREVQTAEAEVRTAVLERDRSMIKVRSAESALANAGKAIGNAQTTYRVQAGGSTNGAGRVNLVAAVSGTVTHMDISRGQAVDRTQTLFEIENLDSVWVTANVPERDAAKVGKGTLVTISVSGLDREFTGVVQVAAGRVDPKTRAVPVQCLVTDANGALRPQMFAKVRIGFGGSSSSVGVPSEAVVEEAGKSYVFVQEGDAFEKHEVQVGEKSGKFVSIKSGLDAGTPIAIKGAFILNSQQKKDELKGHEH